MQYPLDATVVDGVWVVYDAAQLELGRAEGQVVEFGVEVEWLEEEEGRLE